jgi:hypothetical protein
MEIVIEPDTWEILMPGLTDLPKIFFAGTHESRRKSFAPRQTSRFVIPQVQFIAFGARLGYSPSKTKETLKRARGTNWALTRTEEQSHDQCILCRWSRLPNLKRNQHKVAITRLTPTEQSTVSYPRLGASVCVVVQSADWLILGATDFLAKAHFRSPTG